MGFLIGFIAAPQTRIELLLPLTFCALHLANICTMKLQVLPEQLCYTVWFKRKIVELKDINSLEEERWDGGWLMLGSGPKNIRVLRVRMDNDEHKFIDLDFAFMPYKRLDKLVITIRSQTAHAIKGYDPRTPHSRTR